MMISFVSYAQTSGDFKAFLQSFRYENKKDSILMLGKFETPKEFGCGTAAVEYGKQIESFVQGKRIKDVKLLQTFKEKIENPVFWSYLYGSVHSGKLGKKETSVNFTDNQRTYFLKNTIRLSINYQKTDSKNVVYQCVFTKIKDNKRWIDNYYFSKKNGVWTLDKIFTQHYSKNYSYYYID